MPKVTFKMVKYWVGDPNVSSEVIKDYKDIANGEYLPSTLKEDITQTCLGMENEYE